MPIHFSWAAKLLTAGVFALAIAAAPMAHAEGGGAIPAPEPAPAPVAAQPGGSGGCQSGESPDPTTGDCVPTMTPIASTQGDEATDDLQPRTTQDITSTAETGIAADTVPNINGYPCTGYWESAACYEAGQDEVAFVGPAWNDQISSIQCRPGCAVEAFADANYAGLRQRFEGEVGFVGPFWNDKISSYRVTCRRS